jgi:hypothetical protein
VLYGLEFLLALLAVFTAWAEIGGQDALDVMPWGWKAGLAAALSVIAVGLTAAVSSQSKLLTLRSARWFVALAIGLALTGIVTYYYSLQVDTGDSEDSGIISMLREPLPARPRATC